MRARVLHVHCRCTACSGLSCASQMHCLLDLSHTHTMCIAGVLPARFYRTHTRCASQVYCLFDFIAMCIADALLSRHTQHTPCLGFLLHPSLSNAREPPAIGVCSSAARRSSVSPCVFRNCSLLPVPHGWLHPTSCQGIIFPQPAVSNGTH